MDINAETTAASAATEDTLAHQPVQLERTTGQVIWDVIRELNQRGQSITRQRLKELTGLKYTIVDDHVSRWIEDGRLNRILDGVFEIPAPVPEPRAVSVTDLHNGTVVIELGDQELRAFLPEARALARQLGGYAAEIGQLQTKHDMAALLTEATVRNRALSNRISDLEREARERKLQEAEERRNRGRVAAGQDADGGGHQKREA